MKTIAIILASGVGARLGLSIPKQFFQIKGKSVLERSIIAFHNHGNIDEIIIVSHPDYINDVENKDIQEFKKQFFEYFASNCAELEAKLNAGAKLEDSDKEELVNHIKNFKENIFKI